MALSVLKQTLEIEDLVGTARGQTLLRAEALVSGAGREVIEVLLSEATVSIGNAETQEGRVVMDGTLSAQAVYRQGDDKELRPLSAQSGFNYVLEMTGAQNGMPCRVQAAVEHVEAKYESGHMVFLVTVGFMAQVTALKTVEAVDRLEGIDHLETRYGEITSVKLAAEATAEALLTETVPLPEALEADDALLNWSTVLIESTQPDLGGVRVKGKVFVETLIESDVAGRPAALIKYPLAFDRLVELPEWLAGNVQAAARVRSLSTQVQENEEDDADELRVEAELVLSVRALSTDTATVLEDAYTTSGVSLVNRFETIEPCVKLETTRQEENFRGTVILPEDAPGVGSVLAVRVRPVLGGVQEQNGLNVLEGVLEASVLYMPVGSDRVTARQTELPFSVTTAQPVDAGTWISIEAGAAEASALMRDRLEVRCSLFLETETRKIEPYTVVTSVEEGGNVKKRPGIVLFWPGENETVWSIAKRYGVSAGEVRRMNGNMDKVEKGKAVLLRI